MYTIVNFEDGNNIEMKIIHVDRQSLSARESWPERDITSHRHQAATVTHHVDGLLQRFSTVRKSRTGRSLGWIHGGAYVSPMALKQ